MRAAFARASSRSTSKDKPDPNEGPAAAAAASAGTGAISAPADTSGGGGPTSNSSATARGQRFRNQHHVKVKIKSASVESNQTIPSVRCTSLNSYDEDASTSEPSSQTGSGLVGGGVSEKTRSSSQESLKPSAKSSSLSRSFLSISPLRPSLSTSCLFSGSSTDETSKDCDSAYDGSGSSVKHGQGTQQASNALICIPTRASLTHEWRRLKAPNKCRECNQLVYFNGRECSLCGFVAHKKCITVMVIKCYRTLHGGCTAADHARHKQQQQQREKQMPNVAQATAQSMGGIGAAFFSLRNQNIRPFSELASSQAIQHHKRQACVQLPHHNPIFGQSIDGIDSEQLLDFINRFVYEIDTRGLTSKGIYRVSSIKSKVDKLCHYYDQNPSSLIDLSSFHPNIIANALKMYLRKLPEPLLTNELYESFINIARRHSSGLSATNRPPAIATTTTTTTGDCPTEPPSPLPPPEGEPAIDSVAAEENLDEMLADFREVVDQLPVINRQLAAIIMCHLRRVAEMADENQMSAKNLSIIFGPTLLSAGEHKSSLAIVDNIHKARLVELMIDWAYQIFPPGSQRSSRGELVTGGNSSGHCEGSSGR